MCEENIQRYSCQEIDSYNPGNEEIPDLPQFATIRAFLSANPHCFEVEPTPQQRPPIKPRVQGRGRGGSQRNLDRRGFGVPDPTKTRVPVIFNQDDSFDGKLKSKINELNSKITEGNFEKILQEFKELEFNRATNLESIAHSLHRSVLVCSKYGDQILGLFQTLLESSPQYAPELEKQFLSFGLKQCDRLLSIDDSNDALIEEKYTVRQSIIGNHELILKCMKMGIIFKEDTCQVINHQIKTRDHPDSFEVLIRFLILQKKYGYWPTPDQSISQCVDELEKEIKVKNYPKRLEFLLMDLE